jgi:hypothetical protein
MGFGRPGWAGVGAGRAFRLGPNREDKICFLSKYFSVQKQIQEMPRKSLEARIIPRKSQNFQKNSQR